MYALFTPTKIVNKHIIIVMHVNIHTLHFKRYHFKLSVCDIRKYKSMAVILKIYVVIINW